MIRFPLRFVLLIMACNWITSLTGQLSISQIQGRGNISPLLDSRVELDTCVVTLVAQGSFFVTSLDRKKDNDIQTSESLWVLFGNSRTLQPGDLITAVGRITEDGSFNTVLIAESVLKVGSSAVPQPVKLDTLLDLTNREVLTYENLEGAWVSLTSAFLVRPKEKGDNYLVNPLGIRSFREPGIQYPLSIPGIAQFDNNPELLSVEPGRFIQPPDTSLPAGARLTGSGVLVQRPDGYAFWPTSLLVESSASYTIPERDNDRVLSIASMNIRQFGRDDPDYKVRLQKISDYIKTIAGYPDIIALQEIQSAAALEDLVQNIGLIDGNYRYQFFIDPGNGASNIHSAYLFKPCFDSITFQRLGVFESLSSGGLLHDRAPVLMEFNAPGLPNKRIHILNLHLRSLNGIEGNNADFVRRKRYEQSQSVARMITRIDPEEPLIVLGDFNAYPYTDGYVDVFNQISGKKSQGALLPVIPILSDSLDAPLLKLDKEDQFSFIFQANSQLIDHILTRTSAFFQGEKYWMLRGNADIPESWLNDPDRKWRFTDHDGILAHFDLLISTFCKEPEVPVNGFSLFTRNPQLEGSLQVTIEIPEDGTVNLEIFSLSGSRVHSKSYALVRGSHQIDLNADIFQGIYLVRATYADERRTIKWVVY